MGSGSMVGMRYFFEDCRGWHCGIGWVSGGEPCAGGRLPWCRRTTRDYLDGPLFSGIRLGRRTWLELGATNGEQTNGRTNVDGADPLTAVFAFARQTVRATSAAMRLRLFGARHTLHYLSRGRAYNTTTDVTIASMPAMSAASQRCSLDGLLVRRQYPEMARYGR